MTRALAAALAAALLLASCGGSTVPSAATAGPTAASTSSPGGGATAAPSVAPTPTPTAAPTPSVATVADLIGGPVTPIDANALNATPFVQQGDFAAPVNVCEGRPLVKMMYAERAPATGERLLACEVALAYGWRAYSAAGQALQPGYLTAEKAVYAYALTALGGDAKAAIDAVLTEMGAGAAPLPSPVAGLQTVASLAKAKASAKITAADLHSAFQTAITPWIARLAANSHLPSAGLLDPTGPAVDGKAVADVPGVIQLATYFDVVGEPSAAVSVSAEAAWRIYAVTGDTAFYSYVVGLVAEGAAQAVAANRQAGISGWTLASAKAAILWQLGADLP